MSSGVVVDWVVVVTASMPTRPPCAVLPWMGDILVELLVEVVDILVVVDLALGGPCLKVAVEFRRVSCSIARVCQNSICVSSIASK